MTYRLTAGLLCDLVRREESGKLLVVGVYSSGIVVGKFPDISHFTLLSRIEITEPGAHEIKVRVKFGDRILHEAGGTLEAPGSGFDWIPVVLQPIELLVPGELAAEFLNDGGEWIEFFRIGVERAAA